YLLQMREIYLGAQHSIWGSIFIVDHISSIVNMRVISIFSSELVFIDPLLLSAVNNMLQAVDYSFSVIFMYPFVPGANAVIIFIVVISEQAAVGVIPPYLVGDKIPIPNSVVSCLGNQPESFIAS